MNFGHSAYNVNEGSGPVQFLLVLSNPLSTDITIEVFNTNVTAMGKDRGIYLMHCDNRFAGAGEDYESGPYSVMIPARMTSVSFDIPITNDDVLEQNENFNLTINTSSLPSRVFATNPYQATVTIMDDDGKINNYRFDYH